MEIKPLTLRQFRHFQDLIRREAGIHLTDVKQALLVHRLSRRIRELNLDSFGSYLEYISMNHSELQQMLNCICTNETQFFREPYQFDLIRNVLAPEWKRRAALGQMSHNIRAWCAACSTGEEPYSLAMLLLECFPETEGWNVEIVATDLSTKALRHAMDAIWPIEKSAPIPERLLKRFCLKGVGSQAGKIKIGAEVRRVVKFSTLNLNDSQYMMPGRFQLVFCRNALIYFSPEDRARVISQLLQYAEPSGYFFVGHAESLSNLSLPVRMIRPTVYQVISGREDLCETKTA